MPNLLIAVESCTPRQDGSVAVKLFPHQVTASKEVVFNPEHFSTLVPENLIATVSKQATELLELHAKINRMATFIKLSAAKWEGVHEVEPTMLNLLRVAKELPSQSLLETKAVAGREAYRHCLNHWSSNVLPTAFNDLCENYYNQVIKRGWNEPV